MLNTKDQTTLFYTVPPLVIVADDLDNVTMTMLQGDYQAVKTFAVFPPQHVLILAQNGGGEQDFYDVNVTMLAGFKQCLERNCGVVTDMSRDLGRIGLW